MEMIQQQFCQVELRFALKFIEGQNPGFGEEYPFFTAFKKSLQVIADYLSLGDWKVRENSNMAYSLQGLNNYVSSEISKVYWLNKIYPPEIRSAHTEGDLHIHDLNLLSVYCVGWDLLDLLRQGFKGVEGKVESSAPRHLRSALGQIVNFFYTLQGEAAGAQDILTIDRYAHLVGGCRMGTDPETSVVDADGCSWDIPNLWICDGSLFPTCGGVNPSLTIQALACRAADRISQLSAAGELAIA